MNILQIGILIFALIETGNILMLYFSPGSKMGNGVGVFNAWEDAQKDDRMRPFVTYLVNWVAGAKLIFIMMALVVIIFGNRTTQLFTVVALIISILSFYWRLFPSIKKMDAGGEITPKGYSKTLGYMITGFIAGFIIILVVSFL
ncbi:MAG: hypothetical protein R3232_01875 [Clostridia bacterium]|nr:hypothetical protein [Clostridia bacterium]